MVARILIVVVILLFSTTYASAQSGKGVIKGKVYDYNYKIPMGWADMLLIQDGKTKAAVLSEEDGSFTIRNLAPGDYELKVRYIGCDDMLIRSISVKSNDTSLVNVRLIFRNMKPIIVS